jgi:hypothetical protein
MATVLQLESEAFAYGEEEFSDVELVFVQEQPDLSEQVEAVPLQQQPKAKRGAATKRQREGENDLRY